MTFRAILSLLAVLWLGAPVGAQETPAEIEMMRGIWTEDWPRALAAAGAVDDPVAPEIVQWVRLRRGEAEFSEYELFLIANGDWPGIPFLRDQAEAAITEDVHPARVMKFFEDNEPQTGWGALRMAQALHSLGRSGEAQREIIRAWSSIKMSRDETDAMLRAFGGFLEPYHANRVDWLLWEGRTGEAGRLLPLISPDRQALAEARIALIDREDRVNPLIDALPETALSDPGLMRDRFEWRLAKGFADSAAELLLEVSQSPERLGRPVYWAKGRLRLARAAYDDGRFARAYLLASNHHLKPVDGQDYASLEWLLGLLALSYLERPVLAIEHFENFRSAVQSPISTGRAGYWLGRALEAAGHGEAARIAYGLAAVHQTSFYGQLAAAALELPPDAQLRTAIPLDWSQQDFMRADNVRAALIFQRAGETLLTQRFLRHHSETATAIERAALAQLALDIGAPQAALAIGKEAASSGIILTEAYYPLPELPGEDRRVEDALIYAVIRQESSFNASSTSSVGAQGLMQVMPATARGVAEDLDVEFDPDKLTDDPAFNILIGSSYLREMIDRYDGSYLLAIAAYNAGPGRIDDWIVDYGDPRDAGTDPLLWMERIPFEETRNYVQRVMEGVYVYRFKLGEIDHYTLPEDLSRGKEG